MTRFRLERDDEPDLEFDGELLAETDSLSRKRSRSDRWSEVRIYRASDGRYVTEQVRFSADGEVDARTVRMIPATDVVESLRLPGRDKLTLVAVHAVRAAAAVDEMLNEHAVERI
jgi:hypothetical protein